MSKKPKPEFPTPQLVDHFNLQFNQNDRYSVGDRTITKLIQMIPQNIILEDILLKVCVINNIYGTQIYATIEVAKHILDLNIDKHLANANTTIVDQIANIKIGNKEKNLYSFATKYCSWHNQDDYSIYDKYVDGMLVAYRDHYAFAEFEHKQLRKYVLYKEVIEKFRKHFNLTQYSLKYLDKFLWLYGKELFPTK